MYHLGIDIGGTNLKFGLLNSKFELIDDFAHKLPQKYDLTTFCKLIVDLFNEIENKYFIKSIGVGVPGVIDNSGKVIVSPNLSILNNFDLLHFLKQNLKTKKNKTIPIKLENDANVAAIAEMTIGKGKDYKNFVYITLGTGVGGAIILNRQIYRGNNGSAGEIGHIVFNPNARNKKRLYRTGVLEEYLGKSAIVNYTKKLARKFPNSKLTLEKKYDLISITDYAEQGDELALESLKKMGYYLGLAVTSIANFLDINNFIIGGGISKSSDLFYNYANTIANSRVLPHLQNKIIIERAYFSGKAGIIGSAIYGAIK